MSQIEIRGLVKRFGSHTAVDNVSFTVEGGTFLVILGPSGCGKSTILRMVAGLEEASGGSIRMGGRDVRHVDPSKRGVSMVFQSYALFPHLSVAENIVFGLKVRKVAKQDRLKKLHRVAEMVGLHEVLQKKPGQLSGGQRQRVALARAVVAEHPVCLMDEPLSNLDAKLRHEMRVEIRALQKRLGLSVIYVTHDQTEAMSMADKVLVVNEGRVEQIGAPDDVYGRPESTFVARFIGAPPMNLIPVESIADCTAQQDAERLLPNGASGGFTVGIRPENLQLNEDGPGLPVKICSTDYHGADTMIGVRLQTNGLNQQNETMVRMPGRVDLLPGSNRMLSWSVGDAHLFDIHGKRQGR